MVQSIFKFTPSNFTHYALQQEFDNVYNLITGLRANQSPLGAGAEGGIFYYSYDSGGTPYPLPAGNSFGWKNETQWTPGGLSARFLPSLDWEHSPGDPQEGEVGCSLLRIASKGTITVAVTGTDVGDGNAQIIFYKLSESDPGPYIHYWGGAADAIITVSWTKTFDVTPGDYRIQVSVGNPGPSVTSGQPNIGVTITLTH